LEAGERPKPSTTPERRIYVGTELTQVLAAATEPWRTLFRLASVVGGRESELLGLWWEDVELGVLDRATIPFSHQVGRDGKRVALKTEESKATLPLPRSTALMLLEHKARTPAPISPRSYVFSTRIGRPLHQRNMLRRSTGPRSALARRTADQRSRSSSRPTGAGTWSSTPTATTSCAR
jgi:integrase